MKIKILNEQFIICKVAEYKDINFEDPYFFVGKTEEELSLVCTKNFVPKNVVISDVGWKAFRIQGELDFSLVGILSKISTLLAEAKIGIFAISTYNTDYVLTKEDNFNKAIHVLQENGYEVIE